MSGVEADLTALMGDHRAEWRGSAVMGRVRWVCTCGDCESDDYADQDRHRAAALLASGLVVPASEVEALVENMQAQYSHPNQWAARDLLGIVKRKVRALIPTTEETR